MVADEARVVHAIPGRIRIKLPALRSDEAVGRQVAQRLTALRGVRRVETNPTTGSLLIEYDPARIDVAASIQCVQELSGTVLDGDGLAQLAEWLARPPNGSVSRPQPERRRGPGTAASEGAPAMKSLLPLSLAALGVGRLLSGNAPPPQWYDYFWFAFSTHYMLNRRSGGQA